MAEREIPASESVRLHAHAKNFRAPSPKPASRAARAAGYTGTTSSRGQPCVQNSTPSSFTWNVSSVWKRTPSW